MDSQRKRNNYDLWHRDPNNWRMGVFYVNKNDPRVIVPKRNPGLGMTLNFGNPVTYLVLLSIVLIIAYFFVH
jgi:uncharacterized membrane protein